MCIRACTANCICLSLVDDCGSIHSHGNGSCVYQAKSHYKIAAQLKQQTGHIVDTLYNVLKLSLVFVLFVNIIHHLLLSTFYANASTGVFFVVLSLGSSLLLSLY